MSGQNILALCAFVMSIVSVGASITFSILQVQHNRNSVRPIGSILIGDYEDSIFVEVHNDGTGPLIIKKLYSEYGEQQYDSLIDLFEKIHQPWVDFAENVDGRTIPVGGKIVLLHISPKDEETKATVRSILGNVVVTIIYSDIYCKEFFARRSLTFFHRHILTV